jgi:hypothetical protein
MASKDAKRDDELPKLSMCRHARRRCSVPCRSRSRWCSCAGVKQDVYHAEMRVVRELKSQWHPDHRPARKDNARIFKLILEGKLDEKSAAEQFAEYGAKWSILSNSATLNDQEKLETAANVIARERGFGGTEPAFGWDRGDAEDGQRKRKRSRREQALDELTNPRTGKEQRRDGAAPVTAAAADNGAEDGKESKEERVLVDEGSDEDAEDSPDEDKAKPITVGEKAAAKKATKLKAKYEKALKKALEARGAGMGEVNRVLRNGVHYYAGKKKGQIDMGGVLKFKGLGVLSRLSTAPLLPALLDQQPYGRWG